jgi:hypothetical protein
MKRIWISLGILLGIFFLLHLLLEPIVENFVNKKLQQLEGYQGSIRDVDIHLYRGAYRVEGIDIQKKGDTLLPFVQIDTLDLSVDWKALFDGELVGEVKVFRPVINYVAGPSEDVVSDTAEVNNWTEKIQELIPLTINRFEVRQGNITYSDPSASLQLDTYLKDLDMLVVNISNVQDKSVRLPTALSARAETLGGGRLEVSMNLNLLQKVPEFNAKLQLDTIDLTALNHVFEAYAHVDVQKGYFSMLSEMNIENELVEGYIKPFFEDLEVFDYKKDVKEEKGFFGKIWEALVGLGSEVIENQPKERIASKVPIKGSIEKMDTDISIAFWNIFQNAFIQVIQKQFDVNSQAPDPPKS